MPSFPGKSDDWTAYHWPDVLEVDIHGAQRRPFDVSYDNIMAQTHDDALTALARAQAEGYRVVLFIHNSSTSRPGKTPSAASSAG